MDIKYIIKKLILSTIAIFLGAVLFNGELRSEVLSAQETDDICLNYSSLNLKYSISNCLELAKNGNARAQGHMGKYYESTDNKLSETWYLLASKNGSIWSERQLTRMRAMIHSGKKDFIHIGVAITLLTLVLIYFSKKGKTKKNITHIFLLFLPFYFCIFYYFLFRSLGYSGSLNHPIVHKFAPSLFPMSKFFPFIYFPIYVYLLVSNSIKRKYTLISMFGFYLIVTIAIFFILAIVGLASQGAGK